MRKELILNNDPKSIISESIRTLRTNLQFSSVDKKIKSILVTSSIPSEGKSFVSANLAIAFAQTGSKVLLVDCDIRKGRQHYVFGYRSKLGLSNLLLEDVALEHSKYIQPTEIENLSVLFRGVVPPNPSELLNSEKNKELVSILKDEYDIIIFDSAPVNGLTDSLIMSSLVDGVVIVSSLKTTPVNLLEETKKSLENVNANIIGVIVNRVDNKSKKYYGHYYGESN
ncbi:MAG: CpsD/CapB family tyrosine-protein kinase [Bacilli bacterium]|nr:CpsD/CapB family tyrosine-protein kinase [Bacilli bacterium]